MKASGCSYFQFLSVRSCLRQPHSFLLHTEASIILRITEPCLPPSMRLEGLSLSAVLQILNQEITKYRSLDNFNLVTDIAQFNNRSVLLKSDDFHCYTTHILIQLFWIKNHLSVWYQVKLMFLFTCEFHPQGPPCTCLHWSQPVEHRSNRTDESVLINLIKCRDHRCCLATEQSQTNGINKNRKTTRAWVVLPWRRYARSTTLPEKYSHVNPYHLIS